MGMKTFLVEVPDTVTAKDIEHHLKVAMRHHVIAVRERSELDKVFEDRARKEYLFGP